MADKSDSMILSMHLNLEDVMTGDHWGTTVGEIMRDAIKAEIRAEIKKAVKNDKKFKKLISDYKELAIKEMMQKLEGKQT